MWAVLGCRGAGMAGLEGRWWGREDVGRARGTYMLPGECNGVRHCWAVLLSKKDISTTELGQRGMSVPGARSHRHDDHDGERVRACRRADMGGMASLALGHNDV
jgi:hypothetical protein